jgi:hypothetical protein
VQFALKYIIFRVSFIAISLGFILFPIHPIQALEAVNQVEVIAPTLGSKVVPETLRLVLRFTGPQAVAAQKCDFDFPFYMLGTDSLGRSGLFSNRWGNPGSSMAGFIQMESHDGKIIPNGIECFVDLGKTLQSSVRIVDAMHKSDWSVLYLKSHGLPYDEKAVTKFVEDWQYMLSNSSTITQITISTGSSAPVFRLQPVKFSAISGVMQLQIPMLTRGTTLSTGTPLRVEFSGAPNRKPNSVSINIVSPDLSGWRDCLLDNDKSKPGSRAELTFVCRIPRIYAGGQVSISAMSTDGLGASAETGPVTVNLVKSETEKIIVTASSSECETCRKEAHTKGRSGLVRVTGKVSWHSDDGVYPLFKQAIRVCQLSCSERDQLVTDGAGEFTAVLEYDYEYGILTESGLAPWLVEAFASDLRATVIGKTVLKLPAKLKSETSKPPLTKPTTPKVANVKAGSTCKNVGLSTRVSVDNFTCTKKGSKKVWVKTGYWKRTCKQIAYPNPSRCVGRISECINGDTREFIYVRECSEVLVRG